MPRDFWPETDEQWQWFNRIILGCNVVTEKCANRHVQAELLEQLFNTFFCYIRKGHGRLSMELRDSRPGLWSTIADLFSDLQRWCELTALRFGHSERFASLAKSRAAKQLLSQHSAKGVVALARISEETKVALLSWCHQDHESKICWPSLLRETKTFDGVLLKSLRTSYELDVEGLFVKHCVSQYKTNCLFDNVHIVSLHSEDDDHRSTAEIRINVHPSIGYRAEIVQHKARENTEPLRRHARALEKLVLELNTAPNYQEWLSYLMEQMRCRQQSMHEYTVHSMDYELFLDDQFELAFHDYDATQIWLREYLEMEAIFFYRRQEQFEEAY